MRILVIGSGGREHALAWKLRQSTLVRDVVCAPGNGGIEEHARCISISPDDHEAVIRLAHSERIDYAVVGPEAPLAAGLADKLREQGVPVVGPGQRASRLESSKVFAKEFMERHHIPTAPFHVYEHAPEALSFLDSRETRYPIVVKADGLAAGKGVVVARTVDEARKAVHEIMVERKFGTAGQRVVIEDCLVGTEASYIVFTDGERILPAVPSRDHKAVHDGDRGPNTGGMGAYSTDHILTSDQQTQILGGIIRPTVDGMREEGAPLQGILYAGLILTSEGPRVLEFNVRMGDPEGQVILPRLASDFAALCDCLSKGRLDEYKAEWTPNAAVCVVLASGGYPGPYETGRTITGLDLAEEDHSVIVFHSGTVRTDAGLQTKGGRVLGVTAVKEDLASAVMAAYEAVNKIHFEGKHCRRDIGAAGLKQGE